MPIDEPALPAGDGGLVRLRLDLGYDGTAFAGWARQAGERTVQGELETALARVLRLPQSPDLTVAGRTDAGVHARGQVAHVDVPVRTVTEAPHGFDARLSAVARGYAYRTSDAPAGWTRCAGRRCSGTTARFDDAAMPRRALVRTTSPDTAASARARRPDDD